jgi:acyl-CoA dehydrogenase
VTRAVEAILTRSPDVEPIASRSTWWARHRAIAHDAEKPMDLAILAGFAADRLGYAFGSGYQAALRALVPDLPDDRVVSLCVTERGGGHPRAIETRLERADGGHRLTGHKRWATLGGDAGVLLVVASEGEDEHGKKRLRVARIDSAADGVTQRSMPDPPFTPEIAHDEIDLDGVFVRDEQLLPGDGFSRYVRPFRTVEDLHVQAAAMAYALREARAHDLPRAIVERLAASLVTASALGAEDPSAPSTHIALAGVIELGRAVLDDFDEAWASREGSPALARWQRDRPLLSVAQKAREQRTAKAWGRLLER